MFWYNKQFANGQHLRCCSLPGSWVHVSFQTGQSHRWLPVRVMLASRGKHLKHQHKNISDTPALGSVHSGGPQGLYRRAGACTPAGPRPIAACLVVESSVNDQHVKKGLPHYQASCQVHLNGQ